MRKDRLPHQTCMSNGVKRPKTEGGRDRLLGQYLSGKTLICEVEKPFTFCSSVNAADCTIFRYSKKFPNIL